jgi:hypothetical protein
MSESERGERARASTSSTIQMESTPARVIVEPSPTSELRIHGPLTYPLNRALMTPRARVPGTFRIALVGDSMTYGAGLPYRQSLGARLGHYLNAALPEHWVECVTLGVPGGCLYHAVGRMITQAVPLDPDIIVLCVCRNDAMPLGAEPANLEELGRMWVEFRSLMCPALAACRDAAAIGRTQALVLYHDAIRRAGGVCLPEMLAEACTQAGLPYLDGSAALASYRREDVTVSSVDRHLNAMATDMIARQVAQFVVARSWTPLTKGFAESGWIETIEAVAEARIEAGLPAALAIGDALEVLEGRWRHRRNSNRLQLESRYAAARQRLLERHRGSLARLASELVARTIRATHPLVRLTMEEQWTNEAMALSFVLEQYAAAVDGHRTLPSLDYLYPEASSGAPSELPAIESTVRRWQRTGARATRALRVLLDVKIGDDGRHDSSDLQYLFFWTSRVAQWCFAVERCAARYLELLPRLRLPVDQDIARLVARVHGMAEPIEEQIQRMQPLIDAIPAVRQDAARAAGARGLTLDFTIAAPPGKETWGFNVGIESQSPAYTERHVGCGTLIRDGHPHAFAIDIPLMIAGDIHVRFYGAGLLMAGEGLRVYPTKVRWSHANLPDLTLPRLSVERTDRGAGEDSIALVYRDVRPFPLPA